MKNNKTNDKCFTQIVAKSKAPDAENRICVWLYLRNDDKKIYESK